uniref:ATP-dependent Clp protease proteolytic subunit n=1 Tax=Opuntia streptacantha TaxID=393608 RepID=A0A7C9CZI7_OPUST
MANCLRVPMASCSIPSSSANSTKRGAFSPFCSMKIRNSAKIPMPPINPNDPFIKKLSSVAARFPEMILDPPKSSDNLHLPYLDLVQSRTLMAASAQAQKYRSSRAHRMRKSPPDLASRILQSRVVYIGMPLVPAVTELVIAQLLYLMWEDPTESIYLYINSTGTTRDDFEPIAFGNEGFAIYDVLMSMPCQIYTVGMGFALGHACLLLASGTKGKRFMFPDAKATMQDPQIPVSGLMKASDVRIRAREAVVNRKTFIEIMAKETGNSEETIEKVMRKGVSYIDAVKAKELGIIDKVLLGFSEKIMGDVPARKR